MDNIKMVINDYILKEMYIPLTLTLLAIIVTIIITIILVKKSLRRSDKNEKK